MNHRTEIFCVGLNHRKAAVHVRERLALPAAEQLRLLNHARHRTDLNGLVLVGTCNRVEFYGSVPSDAGPEGTEILRDTLRTFGRPLDEFELYLYEFEGIDAAAHLARVAAGLDALVLGEAEILGQLDRALRQAQEHDTADSHLSALFRFALTAGRKARAETGISRHPVSVSSLAVRQAERQLGTLAGKCVAVLGLGETGGLVATHLAGKDLGELLLVNRSSAAAEKFARRERTAVYRMTDIPEVLSRADVVFSCTGCPFPIVEAETIRRLGAQRGTKPLLLVDLAVPHDIDQDVSEIPGVMRIDIDSLNVGISESLRCRESAVPAVEAVLKRELVRFERWRTESRVQPVISDLRKKADRIRAVELERLARHLPDLPDDVRAQIERFSASLVRKLFHDPTRVIREEAADSDPEELTERIRTLFQLDDRTN